MRARVVLVLAFLTSGCSVLRLGSEPIDKIRTDPCKGGAALPAKLLEPGGALLFGESHGTKELPAFFGEAVCWTSGALPVQAGLEVPGAEQGRVETFLASPGAATDVEALTAGPFWTTSSPDGRTSKAMVALLDRLRRLRVEGRPIEVFLFDIDDSSDMAGRDRAMADTIAARVGAHAEALTMVLVGNLHAQKNKGTPSDPDFEPMGWHLAGAGVRVVSLNHAAPAGTAWTCQPAPGSAPDCGSHAFPGTPPLPSGRTIGIEILAEPTTEGYDGFFATPTMTASPPALQVPTVGELLSGPG
jgi:hypothetical protein